MIVLEDYDKDGKGNPTKRHYGMSSAAGDTVDMLNEKYKFAHDGAPMPQGSDCFDYSTKKVYFFDGVSWK